MSVCELDGAYGSGKGASEYVIRGVANGQRSTATVSHSENERTAAIRAATATATAAEGCWEAAQWNSITNATVVAVDKHTHSFAHLHEQTQSLEPLTQSLTQVTHSLTQCECRIRVRE